MEVSLDKKLELINKITFFDRFSDSEKLIMAGLADFQQFTTGESLIDQDSINQRLMFIINGSVDILVDQKHVVTLDGGGHVFGEMSFVYESPANASVVASAKATAMIFETAKINVMNESNHDRLRMNIYRSCAEILAKRLIQTNSLVVSAM